jgi:TonB family protein
MKTTIFLIVLLIAFTLGVHAQVDSIKPQTSSTQNTKPEFPGGEEAMYKYLMANITLPADAEKDRIQGRVYITFIVDSDGNITNASVARGVHKSLDDEALRVINKMPKWKPALQNGKPVSMNYVIPIEFNYKILER